MNYSKLVLCMIFAILFSISINAQCPPGWTTNTSVIFGPDPTGCFWEVDFCTKCDVTGASPNSIRVTGMKPSPIGGGCLFPDRNWIIGQLVIGLK